MILLILVIRKLQYFYFIIGYKEVQVYSFQVIEFDDGTSDFVPNTWMSFDPVLGRMVTKFMPPPYDASSFAKLNLLIAKKAPIDFLPVSDWPTYPIILKGQASKLF